MKKIILIICCFILAGCTSTKHQATRICDGYASGACGNLINAWESSCTQLISTEEGKQLCSGYECSIACTILSTGGSNF